MSRPLWFVAGAGAGLYAAVRARRAAESLTVEGMRDRARSLSLGAKMFADEVITAKDERAVELRDQLRLPPPGRHALPSGHKANSPTTHKEIER